VVVVQTDQMMDKILRMEIGCRRINIVARGIFFAD
jgi:hypothetical protein